MDLTDGQVHDLALYAVDWDNQGRSELIQVINAATGSVLDTETISSFSGGEYLQWAVSGNVVIKVTNLGPANAVISGLFLDAARPRPPAASVPRPGRHHDARQLDRHLWRAGLRHRGGAGQPPLLRHVSVAGASTWTWASSTTDPRGLEAPGGSGSSAACWYSASSFTIDVDLTDGQVHDLALYAVDWDNQGRSEQIQVINAATGSVLDTETLSSFTERGVPAVGRQRRRGDQGDEPGRANAVISGLFLDPSTTAATEAVTASTFGPADTTPKATRSAPTVARPLTPRGARPARHPPPPSPWRRRRPILPGSRARAARRARHLRVRPDSPAVNMGPTDDEVHDLALHVIDRDDHGQSETI